MLMLIIDATYLLSSAKSDLKLLVLKKYSVMLIMNNKKRVTFHSEIENQDCGPTIVQPAITFDEYVNFMNYFV